MNEFTNSYKIFDRTSLLIAMVYTIGHIIIAMTVVKIMTGASLFEAGTVALIEPMLNGVWFYLLHRFWISKGQ